MTREEPQKKEFRTVLTKFLATITQIFSFIPIIASILAPMFLAFGFFIYLSYFLFLYPTIDVVNYYILITSPPIFLMVVEGVFLLLGIFLFVHGLGTMIRWKHKQSDKRLVKIGLYKFIRHPQNLGILFISLACIFYVPWMSDIGIRSGDVLSWILFYTLTSLKCVFEECHMITMFGEEYLEYASQTGFYFPYITKKKVKNIPTKKEFIKKRVLIIGIQVLLFLAVIFTVFPLLVFFRRAAQIRFPPPYTITIPSLEQFNIWSEWIPGIILMSLVVGSLLVILIQIIRNKSAR